VPSRARNLPPQPSAAPEQVRRLFGRIAPRYDALNSLLSLGRHRAWKERAALACRVPAGGLALDVCAGTGDIALSLARRGARVIAVDFSRPMLHLARQKSAGLPISFVLANALALPFADGRFEAAVAGFSLRNVASVPRLLAEMARVVRPGGRVVSLETSQPRSRLVRLLYRVYLEAAIAAASLFSERAAYRYLLRTIVAFPPAHRVADLLRRAGLVEVTTHPLLLGAAALHTGRRPSGGRGL